MAVSRVNLAVRQGELFGLLGPNGAGKTTLIKMLCTLILPTAGDATVSGHPLGSEEAIRAEIGLVTTDERSFYWRLTGQQNLAFFAALQNLDKVTTSQRIEEVLNIVGLQDRAHQDFKSYSTGMRQRLSIARALLHRPSVLFLDEPTKGLDPNAIQQLHHLIRTELTSNQGITVFLTTHWLHEAESICDRVAIMHKGAIQACGTMPDLRRSFGAEFDSSERYHIHVNRITPSLRENLASQKNATIRKNTIQLPNDETLLNRIIDSIRTEGSRIHTIQLEQIPLEEIFARLTDEPDGKPEQRENAAIQKNPEKWQPGHAPARKSTPKIHRVAWAFLKRDWLSEISYRFSFFLQFAGVFLTVAVFYFVAQLLGDAAAPFLAPYGGNYFAFVLVGIAFIRYFSVGLSSFASSLRRAQTTGTLEAMLTTPTRLSTIIVSSSLWSYFFTTFQVLVYLLIGGLFLDVNLGQGNYLAAILILVLTVFIFSSLGIMAASFIVVLKRGDPITWVFGALSTLLGGVYYPVEVLPGWLQWLSDMLPITYALRAMRLALLQGASFFELAPDLLILALFSLLLFPLGLLSFRFAVRRARMDGSLTHY